MGKFSHLYRLATRCKITKSENLKRRAGRCVRVRERGRRPPKFFRLCLCLMAPRDWLERHAEGLQRRSPTPTPPASTTHAWRKWVGQLGKGRKEGRVKEAIKSTEAWLPAPAQPLAPPLYPGPSFSPIGPRVKGPGLPQDMPASGATVRMANCYAAFWHMFRTHRWGLNGLCAAT